MPVTRITSAPTAAASTRVFPQVTFKSEPTTLLGAGEHVGDVHIGKEAVSFFSTELGRGFSVDYYALGLHAVGQQGGWHLYCQLDGILPEETTSETVAENGKRKHDGEEEKEETEDEPMTEVFFTSPEEDVVEDMFLAISENASLHPDADEEGEERAMDMTPLAFDIPVPTGEAAEVGQVARAYLDGLVNGQTEDPKEE